MKIETKRLNMMINAIANIIVERLTAKEPFETPSECLTVGILEYSKNTEAKMTLEEAVLLKDQMDPIMDNVMDIAHADNPSHDCKTCILMYVCAPSQGKQDNIQMLGDLLDLRDGLKSKGDC